MAMVQLRFRFRDVATMIRLCGDTDVVAAMLKLCDGGNAAERNAAVALRQ